MKRYSLKISGRVQGVGFRYFSQLTATNLFLTGYVKNLYSGEVIMEVQGKQENIDQFINTILNGNKFSKVYDINLYELPIINDEKRFSIQY
ncbi:acylphosphatase [Clostridium botulinum]|uniref:Acylphosphatase n=1 Tax=Clostridium botulinum TaxID=1491 RepID=A0A0M1LCB7_CLOBO|nr:MULTISPECIES: acylphosphatase [Clostridium]KAI3350402.1 acylphosphatase [Clostridium botulinum]KOM88421.1 acylphosphatase [Clostridium botulinum]KOR55080.1 acylphosphatase [Clostridium botulinum]MBN1034745.1 acylphosphatase [Clostridium botulinum]MBN1064134.1 acylphosphatase [Clostridium botulinum]